MTEKFIGVSVLAFTAMILVLSMIDIGMIGAAGVSGAFLMAAGAVLFFCGIPALLRGVYNSVWNAQELRLRGVQIRRACQTSDVLAYRAGGNLAIRDPSGIPWQIYGPAARYTDQHPEPVEGVGELTAINLGLKVERAMVVGGTRSGKTYYCKQLAYHRAERGDQIYAVDPKDYDPNDPWPPGVHVVGQGDDYDSMTEFFDWLIHEEKPRRGRNMGRISQEPFLMVFFDEINETLLERPEFVKPYITVLSKFAQYRIGIFCLGQSDDVGSVGLTGRGQLKKCFDIRLLFEKDPFTDVRRSFARIPNREEMELTPYTPVSFRGTEGYTGTHGPEEGILGGKKGFQGAGCTVSPGYSGWCGADFPGTYPPGQNHWIGHDLNAGHYVYHQDFIETADPREALIARMIRKGASISETCRQVFGSKGGKQSRVIKGIREKFGI